jgi:CRP-like cAMP-binding protein
MRLGHPGGIHARPHQPTCSQDPACARQFGCNARVHGNCSPADMRCCNPLMQLRDRQTLLEAGEASHHIYAVVSGCVAECQYRVDGSRHIVAFHFPGDLFGLSWTGYSQWSAEATCKTVIEPIELKSLAHGLGLDCQLKELLVEQLQRQQQAYDAHLAMLARTTTAERLAAFILELSERIQQNGQPSLNVQLPMRRADIADHLGMSVETVSRSLGELKLAGLIELPRTNTIIITQHDRLEAVANRDEVWISRMKKRVIAA